ncbi:MAG TPA: glycosyltransferase [Thermomicrobiales bacterium]|nr:glycosyltransferase [Thermomicrobiales bacterium]
MRVALVHDYLTQYGGAERVLEALHGRFPEAPVLTSSYVPDYLPAGFREWSIRTSPLAGIPGILRSHRAWLPLYPAIFAQLGRSIHDVDAVIADSSAWAHHAAPRHDVPMLCYCHSPARFLYGDPHYLRASGVYRAASPVLRPGFGALRRLDRRAARRVTRMVANSVAVADRIGHAYGIEAAVVHPPVDIERFKPRQPVVPEEWFLVVSRLVPHKWIDRAIRAANLSGHHLKIIGEGRSRTALGRIAGPSVEFLGPRPDNEVVAHMQRCQALILPGVEDFGMTAVEVQAAGRPVIAARGGGALESVREGVTGLLFDPEDGRALAAAMDEATLLPWESSTMVNHAGAFGRDRFLAGIDRELSAMLGNPTSGDP